MESKNLARPWRETPLIHSTTLSKHAGCQIYLKLETIQPSGSFKSRGIGNFLLSHLSKVPIHERSKIHFYSSSGGNAGLACVHAAVTLGQPASIVVPLSTSAYMMDKIRAAGATDVIQHGASWCEADDYLHSSIMSAASDRGEIPVYVPPFDAQDIWDGHATMIPELLAQLPGPPDALVCSVGGGGLLCGLVQGLDVAGHVNTSVLAVETHGAHSLAFSLEKGELSTLPAITSIATTLGARTVARRAFEYGLRENVKSVVLSDREAMEGCVRFANDERIMVEASCGVSLALCYGGRLNTVLPDLKPESRVVIVVCGGSNVSVGMLADWAKEVGF